MGDETLDKSVSGTLREWRAAEQAAAVARRGRMSAQAAAQAAAEAADAAMATAQAAHASLQAATAAEASAAKTAASAKAAALATANDLVDTTADASLAEVDEAIAKANYQHAIDDAAKRDGRRG